MKFARWLIVLVLLSVLAAACSSGDDDDGRGSSSDDDDDDGYPTPDDDTGDDTGDDDLETGWDGVSITDVFAPDRTTVKAVLSSNPDNAAGDDPSIFSFAGEGGVLDIASVSYSPEDATLTFTTASQKLGVQYTLVITPPARADLITGNFPSADTASFWAYNFDDGSQYPVTADRAVIGEKCVIYTEQGWPVDNAQDAADTFDTATYPIETDLFTDAPDMDENGRITILGLNGRGWYGGYFDPVSSVSEEDAMTWWGMHSNGMEIVFINVQDGSIDSVNVVAHEFQHLLYQERHGFQEVYWDYHNEGLAETAVQAVFGINQYSLDYYLADPNGYIAEGLSLVRWTYALYDNYTQAYIWWIYLAGRLGGIDALHDIFELESGSPEEVDELTSTEFGLEMGRVVIDHKLASWLQESSGRYSYNGLLSFDPASVPTVPAGTESLDLYPFGAGYFLLDETAITYPGTLGPDMVYLSVDGTGTVDEVEPFDADGGVLLVYNASMNTTEWPQEHSGPDLPALGGKATAPHSFRISPAWNDPPPLNPDHPERWNAWREMRRAQMLKTK